MTDVPERPPQVFAGVEEAARSLRGAGLRLSTARRLVLEALFDADGPVSAGHLARQLSLDESSVYRNLELLERRGLVRHLHLGHSPGLYVRSSEDEPEYLYCERCAKVTAVSPGRLDAIRDQLRRELGHSVRFTHFAIVGTCHECSAAAGRSGAGARRGAQAASTRDTGAPARTRRAASPPPPRLHSHGDYVHSHPGRPHHSH